MKKTIMASSLAVALGVTGYAAGTGHQAHAAEVNVDQAHLVDLAHNHQDQLNAAPIKDHVVHFVKDGFQYNFTSNGTTWSWSYEAANGQTAGFSNVAGADYTTFIQPRFKCTISSQMHNQVTQTLKLFQLQLTITTALQLLQVQ